MKGRVLSWFIPIGDGRACCSRKTFGVHDTECEARFSTPVRKPILAALRALALLGLVGFAASEAAAAAKSLKGDVGGDSTTLSWATGSNWSDGSAPAASGDAVYFSYGNNRTVNQVLNLGGVERKISQMVSWAPGTAGKALTVSNGTLKVSNASHAVWQQGGSLTAFDSVTFSLVSTAYFAFANGSETTFKNVVGNLADLSFGMVNVDTGYNNSATVNFVDTATTFGEIYSRANDKKGTRYLNFENSTINVTALANYRYLDGSTAKIGSGFYDSLGITVTLGSKNTSSSAAFNVFGKYEVKSGSTLTIEANGKGVGTYKILSAGELANPGNLTVTVKNGSTSIGSSATVAAVYSSAGHFKNLGSNGGKYYALHSPDGHSVVLVISSAAWTYTAMTSGNGYTITGGNLGANEKVDVYTKTGLAMTWTVPSGVSSVQYLVVGGGGAGGEGAGIYSSNPARGGGGGGGAGEFVAANSLSVSGVASLSITVGAGGTAGTGIPSSTAEAGANGRSSVLVVGGTTITARGGGAGGYTSDTQTSRQPRGGSDFGSGGGLGAAKGGSINEKPGYMNNTDTYPGGTGGRNQGGYGVWYGRGSGGGGAGSTGGRPYKDTETTPSGISGTGVGGAGGAGLASSITGVELYYAGGGGAGGYREIAPGGLGGGGNGGCASVGIAGSENTGSGGGGGEGANNLGGNGGSGVVILRYTKSDVTGGDIADATVTVSPTSATYTGNEVASPTITVTLEGCDITSHCRCTWDDTLKNLGVYHLTVMARQDEPGYTFTGTATAHPTFTIKDANMPALQGKAWKHDVQSGSWSTGSNWNGGEVPTTTFGEFRDLDDKTTVNVDANATVKNIKFYNTAPLTMRITKKLTVNGTGNATGGSWYESDGTLAIGSMDTKQYKAAPVTMVIDGSVNADAQIYLSPQNNYYAMVFGKDSVAGSGNESRLKFVVPANGWNTYATAAISVDTAKNDSPTVMSADAFFEVDATRMQANQESYLFYSLNGTRIGKYHGTTHMAYTQYDDSQIQTWVKSDRFIIDTPENYRGVVSLDNDGSHDIAMKLTLVPATDIANAVVTLSKGAASYTGSAVEKPTLVSVTLGGVGITDQCYISGWKNAAGEEVNNLIAAGEYYPVVRAKLSSGEYCGVVANPPAFRIVSAYYHKSGTTDWTTVSSWYMNEALTQAATAYPDNYDAGVFVYSSGSAVNAVSGGTTASRKVKLVSLKGGSGDSSLAAVYSTKLLAKLDEDSEVVSCETGVTALHDVRFEVDPDSASGATPSIEVKSGATLYADSMSAGNVKLELAAGSTLRLFPGLSSYGAGSGTASTFGSFSGGAAGQTTTMKVENNTATFSGASGVSGKLDLQLKPGANNTTTEMLKINGAFTAGSGSTLKVDASAKTAAGTYPLVRATSFGGMTAAQLAGAATVTTQPSGSKFAKVVATSDSKGLDLVVYNTVAKPTVTTSFTYDGNQKTAGSAATGYSVSGNTGTNADNYTFKATLKSGYCWSDNHSTSDYSVGWKINKANDSVTKPTMAGWKYGESASSPSGSTCTSGTTITYKYYQSNGATLIGTDRPSTPGTYVVKAHSAGNSNYNAGVSEGVSFTISNGTISYTATGYSAAYDGSAHGISVTVTAPSSGATVKYGTASGTYDLTASPTRTNVGTTTVYYQITAANYTTVTGSQTINITRATATEPTVNTGLTYTGSSQSGVKTSGSGVKLGGTQSATNADSYSFTATPDSNHQWSGGGTTAKTYNWSIAAKAITPAVSLSKTTATYGASGWNTLPTVTVKDGSTTLTSTDYTTSWSPESVTGARTYTVTVTLKGNYSGSMTATYTVGKKGLTVTGLTATNREYNGKTDVTLSGGTLSGVVGSDDVSATMPTSGTVSTADAGNNKAVSFAAITLSGTKAGNYSLTQPTVTVNIAKKSLAIPTAKTGLTYTGSAQTGVNNVPSASLTTVSGDAASQTNAKTSYQTTYALNWPANYQWSDDSTTDKTVTWSIAKRSISSGATTPNCYWTGSVVHPPVKCNGRYLVQGTDYTYTINGESVSPVDVGSYSTVVFTGTGNYEGTFTQETWKINRMTYTWSPTTSGNWDDASWTCAGGDAYRTAAQYLSQISSFPNGAFGHNAIVKKGVTISLGSTPRTLYELQLQGDTIKDGSLAFRTMSLTGTTTFKNVNFTANYLASDHYGEIKPGEGATVVFEGQNASDDEHIRLRSDTINNQTFVFKDGSTVLKGSYTLWRSDDKDSHLNANFAITNATVQLASISNMNGSGGYYDLHLFFKPGTVDARTKPLLKVAGAMALSSGATLEVDISDFATTPGVYKLIELGSSLTYGGATCQTFCTAMADNISGKNANYGYALIPATGNKGVNLVVYNPTVTLDNQGATTAGSASVTVTYGADIPKIETPKKTGYAFEGYYAQPGGNGIRYIGSGGDSRHVWDQYDTTTLYANWLKNIDYKRENYTGAYDGLPHGITLEVIDPADASIKYGTVSGTYDLDEPPTLTEVGTMTVYYKIEKAGYGTVSSSKTITITKGSNTFTEGPTISGWTYGSSPSTPSATPKFGGAITYKYYSDSGCTKEITPSSTTAAGTYYLKATSEGTSNYDAVTSAAVSFTVSRKDISGFMTGVPAYGVTYTGSPLTPDVSLVWIGHSDPVKGRDYTVEFSNNINVGDATVKFTGLGNYTGEKTATFKINKATIDKVPSQSGTLTYTGSMQTPPVNAPATTTAGSQTITWTYSLTEGNYGSLPQVGPDAGEYTVYYKATAANHNENTGRFTVTIGKKSIAGGTSKDLYYRGYPYGQQVGDVPFSVGGKWLDPENEYSYEVVSGGDEDGYITGIGTYSVRFTGESNYTGTCTCEVKILKNVFTWKTDNSGDWTESGNWTCDAERAEPGWMDANDRQYPDGVEFEVNILRPVTVTVDTYVDCRLLTLDNSAGLIGPGPLLAQEIHFNGTSSGSRTYVMEDVVFFNNDEEEDYVLTVGTAVEGGSGANATVKFTGDCRFISDDYCGRVYLQFFDGSANCKFLFENCETYIPDGITVYRPNSTATVARNLEFNNALVSTTSCGCDDDRDPFCFSFKLGDNNEVDVTPALDLSGTLYLRRGSTLTVNAGGKDAGTYPLVRAEAVNVSEITLDQFIATAGTVSGTKSGTYAKVVATSDGKGLDLVVYNTVAKPTISKNAETYKGSDWKSLVSPSAAATGCSYAWTGDWTSAGSHSVKATLSSGYCWADGSTGDVTLNLTINKASVTIPTANNEHPVYDGERWRRVDHAPDVTIATRSSNIGQYGSGSVTFALVDKANYQWSDDSTTDKTVSWEVAPKTLTVKWGSTTSWVYDGAPHVPTCTLEGVCTRSEKGGALDDCTPKVSGKQTNVGNYTATVSLDGDQCGYYQLLASEKTKAFSITAKNIADVAMTVAKDKWWWDGHPHVPTLTFEPALTEGIDYTLSATNASGEAIQNYTTGMKALGTYGVRVTGQGNYSGTMADFTFTISRPQLTWLDTNGTNGTGAWTDAWNKPYKDGYANNRDDYGGTAYPSSTSQSGTILAASGRSVDLNLGSATRSVGSLTDSSEGSARVHDGTLTLGSDVNKSKNGQTTFENVTFKSSSVNARSVYGSVANTVIDFVGNNMVGVSGNPVRLRYYSKSGAIYTGQTFRFKDGQTTLCDMIFVDNCGARPGNLVLDNARLTGTSFDTTTPSLTLGMSMNLGANNTTANTALNFSGTFKIASGSTLTVDATAKDPGRYPLVRAGTLTVADGLDTWLAAQQTHVTAKAGTAATLVKTADAKGIDLVVREKVAKPTVNNLVYSGVSQTVATAKTGYTLTGNTGKDVNTYTLTATLSDGYCWEDDGSTDDYSVDWKITPATLTATADNKSVTYGDEAPTYTVTVTGFVNGETAATAAGYTDPTAASTYTKTTGAGSVSITVTGGAASNYTFSYTPGTLTVNKRTITINWTNRSFVYDGQAHKPTATAGNVVNNDTVKLNVTGEQTEVGSYTATAAFAATQANYELPSDKTTTFTITKPVYTVNGDKQIEVDPTEMKKLFGNTVSSWQTALTTANANGVPGWVAYVLGAQTATEVTNFALNLMGGSGTAADHITLKFMDGSLPDATKRRLATDDQKGVSAVKFQLYASDTQGGTYAKEGESQEASTYVLDLSGMANNSARFFKVMPVFTFINQ